MTVIAQRLISLRKHLGERLGPKLTIQDVADKAGIEGHKMIRLEHGRGTSETLITLLLYYRTQSYNLDWILFPDNTTIPMMLSSGEDLLVVSEMIHKFRQRLDQDYSEITAQLNVLGYSPLDDTRFTESVTDAPEVFDFSK